MMPSAAGKRRGKGALFVWLGVAGVAVGVVLIVLLSSGGGGGGALLASLAAELPACERFEFMDFDVIGDLGTDKVQGLGAAAGLPGISSEELDGLFPKGKRGAVAIARTDTERVRIHCPRALEEAALAKLLESHGYEKKSADGVELWVTDGGEQGVALKKGRIYSGLTGVVKDIVLGKLAPEKTMAGSEGCRELLRHLPASPAVVEMRQHSRGASGRSDRPMPSWSSEDIGVVGGRVEARKLGLFGDAEEVKMALKELEQGKSEIEADAKQGRDVPFRNLEFESLHSATRGNLVIITCTFRRTGAGAPAPAK
jgi:hypothetical protein